MAFTAPSIDDLFGGLPAEKRVERFEAYKSALSACHTRTAAGSYEWTGSIVRKRETVADRMGELRDSITKGMSPEQVADIQSALARVEDITKASPNWTLTNPLNNSTSGVTGLVPYDLDPALALLVPRNFTLRNMTPRIGGIGQAYEFRRILGVTNSNTGGVANMSTFFNPTGTSATFGSVSLNRPSKISYAADKIVLSHVNQGVSDSVDLTAQFAGQGYTDLRQLSHTSALWAHMLGEERNMLNARSSVLSISSASATAANDTTVSGSGLPATSSSAVIVTFSSSLGESQAFSVGSVTNATAGQSVKLNSLTGVPTGTLAVNIYVTVGSQNYKGTTVYTNGTAPTTFSTVTTLPSTSADNGSGNSLGYDGYVSTLTGANAGSTIALNGKLSTTIPGSDFQTLFYNLYTSVIGDPDMILTSGAVRKSLADSIQQQANPTGYRLNYTLGADGVAVGSIVNALQNEVTGKMVELVAHPYMPAGTALVHSKTLPFPDSGVSETVQAVNVQDMIVLEWPQIQLSWDISTYQYGTLAFRAPAWSGAITNIAV